MKLSARTVAILKNFSAINQSIVFKPGNVIQTLARSQSVLASATVPEDFEFDRQIWNLQVFLQIVSEFNDPTITWEEKFLTINDGGSGFRYVYGEGMMKEPPYKQIDIDSVATFDLSADELKKILNMARLMDRADELKITLNDQKSELSLKSSGSSSSNKFHQTISADIQEPVTISLNVGDIQIEVLDYKVEVSESSVKFINEEWNLWYLIAAASE